MPEELETRAMTVDYPSQPEAEEFQPVAEYRAAKANIIGSWGLLSDEDFFLRVGAVFAAGLVPGIALASTIYSFTDEETGSLLVRNVAVVGLLGAFVALLPILAVTLSLTSQWDTVNKKLQRRSYYVEYDPTKEMDYGSGSAGAYSYKQNKTDKDVERDRLLANYEVEPVVSRSRAYLANTLVALFVSAVGGSAVGGETRRQEAEQEEDDNGYRATFYKNSTCGAGCVPGL